MLSIWKTVKILPLSLVLTIGTVADASAQLKEAFEGVGRATGAATRGGGGSVGPKGGITTWEDDPDEITIPAAKHVVARINYSLEGAGSLPELGDNHKKLSKPGEANDSYVIVSGQVDARGLKDAYDRSVRTLYVTFDPTKAGFPKQPEGCVLDTHAFPQNLGFQEGYRFYFIFRDTASKPECWRWFQSVGKVTLVLDGIRAKRGTEADPYEVLSAEPQTVSLGRLSALDLYWGE